MSAASLQARPSDAEVGGTWQVSGGIGVDVDDIHALATTCRCAAQATDRIAASVLAAGVRAEAALAVLAGCSGPPRPQGVVAAGLVAGAGRRLPAATVGLAGLGLRMALAADEYAGTENSITTRVATLARDQIALRFWAPTHLLTESDVRRAGTVAGYLDRLANRKTTATDPVSGQPTAVDPDSLTDVLGGPVAALYPRREATVADPTDLGPGTPPAGVAGLLTLVAGRSGGAARAPGAGGRPDGDPPPGRVDVAAVTSPDAEGRPRTSYVVALPGTSDWSRPNESPKPDIRNVRGNAELISGNRTAELAALPAALAAAGVPPGARVAFVGHSQGGMTAYAAASTAGIADRYRVTHVITAGSPIGAMAAPARDVRTLSLENRNDFVPGLDGRPNPNAERRVTVAFDGSLPKSPHDLDQYVAAGRRVDDDADPRLAEFTASLREEGFVAAPGAPATVTLTRVDLRLPTS